jgi:hypothetical protein
LHPEGLANSIEMLAELGGLDEAQQRLVMRGNAARLLGLSA